MSRRVPLPGADELFRSTGPAAVPEPDPERVAAAPVPALVPPPAAEPGEDEEYGGAPARRRHRPAGERRPTGRERHDEKITVYCSAEELIDVERARLTLRGEYGIAADRGRIVREALVLVLADLEAKGEHSVLVRRLRGR